MIISQLFILTSASCILTLDHNKVIQNGSLLHRIIDSFPPMLYIIFQHAWEPVLIHQKFKALQETVFALISSKQYFHDFAFVTVKLLWLVYSYFDRSLHRLLFYFTKFTSHLYVLKFLYFSQYMSLCFKQLFITLTLFFRLIMFPAWRVTCLLKLSIYTQGGTGSLFNRMDIPLL